MTIGPGLVGALLVGMAAAKSIALAVRAPLIGVNHLEGHYWANFLEHGPPDPPYVALIVSGGHTMLVHVPELFRHVVLGQTLDDAAGEAFDKVARLLGLGFPGGPALDAAARSGDPAAVRFPRAMDGRGIWTSRCPASRPRSAPRPERERPPARETDVAGPRGVVPGGDRRCAGVQDDRRRRWTRRAHGRSLGGGVVANTRLRER